MPRWKEIATVLVVEVSIAPALGLLVADRLEHTIWLAIVWTVAGLVGLGYIWRQELAKKLKLKLLFVGNDDPFFRLTTYELATRCARKRFLFQRRAVDVEYWVGLLEESWTNTQLPVTRETELTLGEWVQILHGICRRNSIRLPTYIERAMSMFRADHLINPTDDE